jgi:hypothetical protein
MTGRAGLVLFGVTLVALILLRIAMSPPSSSVPTPRPTSPAIATATPPDGTQTLQPPPTVAVAPTAIPTIPLPGESAAPLGLVAVIMPALITVILLVSALWVILSRRYNDANQKWAFGVLGTIVGFWLNAGR